MAKRGMKVGKKLIMVEEIFSTLPPNHRSPPVFHALAKCAGVNPETAKKRFQLGLALLGSTCAVAS